MFAKYNRNCLCPFLYVSVCLSPCSLFHRVESIEMQCRAFPKASWDCNTSPKIPVDKASVLMFYIQMTMGVFLCETFGHVTGDMKALIFLTV